MNLRLALAFALSASFTAGCYHDDHCDDNQGNLQAPLPEQRNPYTGQCESYGGGGSGTGGSTCGDFGVRAEPDRIAVPDWGICYGYCENLTEDECLQAEECRGSYTDICIVADCDGPIEPTFNECWAITPGGGFSELGCASYDAEECARHNECSAVHVPGSDAAADFAYCMDEPTGSDPGSCVGDALCDIVPPECPDGTLPGIADNCYTGFCIPLDECDALPSCSGQSESQCVLRADCEPVYQGIDCNCDGEECTCADWLYESCS